jgi:hypothetical protein
LGTSKYAPMAPPMISALDAMSPKRIASPMRTLPYPVARRRYTGLWLPSRRVDLDALLATVDEAVRPRIACSSSGAARAAGPACSPPARR